MMENPFKQLEPEVSLPPDSKAEILSNIYSLRLVMQMMDLFLVKGPEAMSKSLSGEEHLTPDPHPMRRPPEEDD